MTDSIDRTAESINLAFEIVIPFIGFVVVAEVSCASFAKVRASFVMAFLVTRVKSYRKKGSILLFIIVVARTAFVTVVVGSLIVLTRPLIIGIKQTSILTVAVIVRVITVGAAVT